MNVAKLTAVALLLLSIASGETRQTKVNLACMSIPQPEAERLLVRYCRDYRIVSDPDTADYMLVLAKDEKRSDLQYSYVVMDPEDKETISLDKRDTLAGAVKDACSAMHIRFGEEKP